MHKGGGVCHVEEVLHSVLDFVLHRELYVHHILVACQHGGFLGHGAHSALLEGSRLAAHVAVAYFASQNLGDLGRVDSFNGSRQGIVGARACAAVVFSKAQDNAFLVRLDNIDAGQKPHGKQNAKQHPQALARGKALLWHLEGDHARPAASAIVAATTSIVATVAAAKEVAAFPVVRVVGSRLLGFGVTRRRGKPFLLGPFFLQLVPVPVFQYLSG